MRRKASYGIKLWYFLMVPEFVLEKSTSFHSIPPLANILLSLRLALFELRMLLSALVLEFDWRGVPDKGGRWDDEMRPVDTVVIHPRGGKCVLNLRSRR